MIHNLKTMLRCSKSKIKPIIFLMEPRMHGNNNTIINLRIPKQTWMESLLHPTPHTARPFLSIVEKKNTIFPLSRQSY